MNTIFFEIGDTWYQIPAVPSFRTKFVRFPDGDVCGLVWSDNDPPTLLAVHTQSQEEGDIFADAIEATLYAPVEKCSRTSVCRDPSVRGGMCVNCGGWINDD